VAVVYEDLRAAAVRDAGLIPAVPARKSVAAVAVSAAVMGAVAEIGKPFKSSLPVSKNTARKSREISMPIMSPARRGCGA